MKYPKLSAALDELLAKQVRDNGEDILAFAIASLMQPVEEKKVAVPVTKEEVVHAD